MTRIPALPAAVLTLMLMAPLPGRSQITQPATGAYAIEFDVMLAGRPGPVYDAITGDISGWWDHSFSQKPYRLYIEAKPGGGFYEIFNRQGEGVKHATVTYAERGKVLRFEGPLGLAGRALSAVTTYRFAPAGGDSTKLSLAVHMAGEIDPETARQVEGVWRHFLIERFKPYVEKLPGKP